MRISSFSRYVFIAAFSLTLGLSTAACAPADPNPNPSADRDHVVATVLPRLESELGKPVGLDVKTLNIADGWAMIDGKILDKNGQLVDYAGTKYAPEIAGPKSKRYDGLLKEIDGKWSIMESAIGPTDVRWVGWKVKYPEAPAQIFDVPME
ncbi:hypothetical protein [Mycobacteroides franklinii]|uniref:Uncharacterized protein n=1 Tax=Mycobacteroides franklinii TaxID=948102 RepID=A0A4V3HUZ9_9MYCO|nr:hypothetical protein [Mycobacteroides franklinii]TDZ43108.1 hypothetical protein CCUG64054_03160 [Mycobacteroides franklinii]TDZ50243.1 hypothetical protein CCUG63697_01746 [Mycobacteroides franklinii]TDZ56663.1 hypothetical protein CCUG63696_03162 [Mycobacteroides franklinii]TDZ63604.1 hypothetical protein CCUG63695_03087 [Mycobacteroides franklinii]TDZ70001.1 hypothetical protein CCUG64056_03160 [Mycobacteroides franklinii]